MSKPQSAMMQHRPTRPPSMPRAIPPSGSRTPSHNQMTMSTPPQMYQPMQAPTTMWTTQSIMGQQQMINPGQPMGYAQQMYVAYNQPYQHYYPQASPNNNSVYFAPMQQQPSQPQVINQGQPPGRPPSAPGMAGPPMGPPTIPPQHSILQQNQQPMSIPTGYPMQRVPMMTPMPQPAQAPPAPRKRNVIAIVDPTTNEAINKEQLLDSQSVHSLGSTPPSVDRMTPTHVWSASENQAPQPNKSVSEEFKKQVLAKLYESTPNDHPSVENGPADSQENHSEYADAAANGVETSDEASLNRVGMEFASSSARAAEETVEVQHVEIQHAPVPRIEQINHLPQLSSQSLPPTTISQPANLSVSATSFHLEKDPVSETCADSDMQMIQPANAEPIITHHTTLRATAIEFHEKPHALPEIDSVPSIRVSVEEHAASTEDVPSAGSACEALNLVTAPDSIDNPRPPTVLPEEPVMQEELLSDSGVTDGTKSLQMSTTEKPHASVISIDRDLMPPPAPYTKNSANACVSDDDKENSKPLKLVKQSSETVTSVSTPAIPPYQYKEDPTDPLDPERKKVYDRDFLLKLQFSGTSKMKPPNLQALSDILNPSPLLQEDMNKRKGPKDHKRDFTPEYIKPLPSPRSQQKSTNRGSMSRDGLRDNRSQTQPVKVLDFKRVEVKLHTADNAWKKGDTGKDEELNPEEKEHMELVKAFRGILNKITPQKFQSLLDKVLALPVKTEKDLNGIMNLVFEKAINEPGFSVTYANLCQRIAKEFEVPTEKDQNEMVNFRKLLLVRCQREFEKSDSDDNEMITMKTTLDHASPEDQARLTEEYNLFCTKARQRKLGNIRFIGELFKLQMLVPKIMHECVMILLKGTDEENLECLCRLLQTIGRELDTENAKPRTDQYFKKMKEIIDAKKVCARVRFALQDVIDLRECNWKPRRENNNPKTIKEIHAEAALEAHEKQMMIDKVQIPNRGSAAKTRGSADRPVAPRRGEDDGWSTVGGTMGARPQRIEPGKLRLTKQSAAEEVQLGPARSLSNWGKGSSGSGKNTPPQQEERPSTPTNRYSALSGGSAGSEPELRSQSGQRFPTGRGSMGRNNPMNRPPVGRMSITPRGSVEKDKERASVLAAVKNVTTQPGHSRGPSRDSSADGRAFVPSAASGTLPRSTSLVDLPSMNKDELKKRIEGILEEYLHSGDIEECISCVRELGPQNCADLVTEFSVMAVLERSQKARRLTGVFLAQLISRDIISVADHIKGLHSQLQYADDLATDIPKLWSYLAEIITPMFISSSNKTADLSLLQEVCLPLKDFGKAAIFAAAVLEEASHKIGNLAASDSWRSNGLRWQDFLDEAENEAEFIATHNLGYTTIKENRTSIGHQPLAENIVVALHKLIVADSASNEAVFDWVSTNCPADQCNQTSFIKALTKAVASCCIHNANGQHKLNEEEFASKRVLLDRYIDAKPEHEVSALFALEELVTDLEYPANLLSSFFYALADDVISDDSFNRWKEATTCGVAVKSVTQFFQWLKEDQS